jgi:hypothetical protein
MASENCAHRTILTAGAGSKHICCQSLQRLLIGGEEKARLPVREARVGLYSAEALDALPNELRDKYFEQNGTQFAFRPDLRRRVIFGRHDITRDAPNGAPGVCSAASRSWESHSAIG